MNLSITDISYAPFLDIFYGLIIFLNILFISSKFQYKLVDFDKKLNLIFNINYLIILISLVFFFIFLIGFDYFLLSKFLKILNLILFFYFIFIFLKNSNQLIKKIKIKKFYSPIFIFIICYFLLSLSPVSDADSLDYHLGIPLDIINNEKLIHRKYWTHFYIFGLGEFFIIFWDFNWDNNFGSNCQLLFTYIVIVFNDYKFKV